MFCRFCGAKNEDNAIFCQSCGKRIGSDPFGNSSDYNPFANSSTDYNPFEAPIMMPAKLSVKALIAFIISLAGLWLWLLSIPLGLAGIILASLSFRDFSEHKMRGKGYAITAIILSSVDILLGILDLYLLTL